MVFDYTEVGILDRVFCPAWRMDVRAYENRRRHLPISLDMDDNQFFTRDKPIFLPEPWRFYEPQTANAHGPCAGAALKPIALIIQEHQIGLETED